MQHARSSRSKSVSDSISNLGPSRFVHVRSWTFHSGVTDFQPPDGHRINYFQFQHIDSQKIIPRDNQVNIKYEVYFNVTLGWNQTDFMVIRARSKTRRVSSRDLSGPYHAGPSWFSTLTIFSKIGRFRPILKSDFGLGYWLRR